MLKKYQQYTPQKTLFPQHLVLKQNALKRENLNSKPWHFRCLISMTSGWLCHKHCGSLLLNLWIGSQYIPFINKTCSGFMAQAFWGAMQEREKTQVKRNDLIDILLSMREKRELEDEHILGQGIQFFTAGYETTSSTIAFALYILSKNKDVQTKLRQEIYETIDKYGDLTYEALQNMNYLDMVVKESMRINPVIPILLRTCNNDYQIPGTKDIIEKGTTVVLFPLGMHQDPKYFTDPMKFVPERFSEENASNINPMVYLPFGEGPRNCIGRRFGLNSTKSGLSHILNKFEINSCEKTHKEIRAHIVGHNYASQDNKIVLNFKPIKRNE